MPEILVYANYGRNPPPPAIPAPTNAYAGKGLMSYLPQRHLSAEKQDLIARFGKRHPERILPGSVLQVTNAQAPTTFTGVLISIRRRGADTSFVLRNVVQRTGVEVQYFPASPHLKAIKLFYLRDSAEKMTSISRGLRA
ncbi:uncharacterized protein BXZ73DRAFT_97154 [Epithele typhae]|uniref:uncharacterized protein n=1 Tax=Epithele typhae TaxID=378194 RepID=UPI002008B8B0|nr:uncharacterized protein BXZ73DRAFT_97154 [Epithele typhae]KAH9943099.1 hypothetical protein BXZ73DRAFT_97154 [Epithele typhae]